MDIQKIQKIEQNLLDKTYIFAANSVKTSQDMYARRGQSDVNKIIWDIRNGKLAEEISYSLLSKNFPNLSAPDYQIYQAGQKSWDADLKNDKIQIAVKSQNKETAERFGLSWIFSKNDTNVFDTNDQHHYACFVMLDLKRSYGVLKAIVSIEWLKQNNLFKPLRKANLNSTKVAVYYDDLKKFLPEQLWQFEETI